MTHPELVRTLKKPGEQILRELTASHVDILHMGIGICGEAGELLDAVKRCSIYCQPIDRENIIEELGDLEYYMEGLRQELLITREQCLEHNITKLIKRYSKKYSDKAAKERRDKI